MKKPDLYRPAAAALIIVGAIMLSSCEQNREAGQGAITIEPTQWPKIGEVDERFQSYNVESVEVTGGNFWAPYPESGQEPEYDTGP